MEVHTMPDLQDGESVEIQGSGSRPYVLKNLGGVYSCSCPAWRNQSLPIERRTCKHLRAMRGDMAEQSRIGNALPALATPTGDKPTPPALLLAETWDGISDPTGWLLSEKLDGVRAYWDGSQFLSRQGNRYHAPAWFTDGLPPVPLDGELWIARKRFQRTVSIVRRQDHCDLWREVRFLVFDAPDVRVIFEQRLHYLADLFRMTKPKWAEIHIHSVCLNAAHLREELARIEALGGEGVMLRQPGSLYEPCRSGTLLKVKTFHDAEARVVGHQPGSGRHKGRLGALLVELPGGIQFAVGTGFSDQERHNPPPIGSIISFRYQELTDAGVPRFPTFVGQRQEEPAGINQSIQQQGASRVASTKTSRRFEFVGGSSDKFYEIQVQGSEVTVRFGRNGTAGQSSVKNFADTAKAAKHTEKLIAEKLRKGYVEVA
jgi:DNA ligase-1